MRLLLFLRDGAARAAGVVFRGGLVGLLLFPAGGVLGKTALGGGGGAVCRVVRRAARAAIGGAG